MNENPAARIAAIRARLQAATEGPWERYPEHGPTFFANTTGSHLQGVGDLNFGAGEQAEADEALTTHAHQDLTYLLARVTELESILGNGWKLVNAWLKTSGEHFSISTIDAVKNNPLLAGMQDGRANQYSDCANELRDVLDGEDPDTWEHGIAISVATTENTDG